MGATQGCGPLDRETTLDAIRAPAELQAVKAGRSFMEKYLGEYGGKGRNNGTRTEYHRDD